MIIALSVDVVGPELVPSLGPAEGVTKGPFVGLLLSYTRIVDSVGNTVGESGSAKVIKLVGDPAGESLGHCVGSLVAGTVLGNSDGIALDCRRSFRKPSVGCRVGKAVAVSRNLL